MAPWHLRRQQGQEGHFYLVLLSFPLLEQNTWQLYKVQYKEKRFNLGHGFRGFGPWQAGYKAETTWWKGMVEEGCLTHGCQEAQERGRPKGERTRDKAMPLQVMLNKVIFLSCLFPHFPFNFNFQKFYYDVFWCRYLWVYALGVTQFVESSGLYVLLNLRVFIHSTSKTFQAHSFLPPS